MKDKVSRSKMIELAKHFNKSHRYKGKEPVAPHHFREQMKLVNAKAKAEMAEHRMSRKKAKAEAKAAEVAPDAK